MCAIQVFFLMSLIKRHQCGVFLFNLAMHNRYLCQGVVLEILARELFLREKLIRNEIPGKKTASGSSKEQAENSLGRETSKNSNASLPSNILSTYLSSSTMEDLITLYSSTGYDKEVILQAKVNRFEMFTL